MSTEIQQFFGSDATIAGIRFQFATRIKDDVKLLKQARNEGQDCKDVVLSSGEKGKGQMNFALQLCFICLFILLRLDTWLPINFLLAIARTMGSDVTAKAVSHVVPRFKLIGKLQIEALASGMDPLDVDLTSTVKDKKCQMTPISYYAAHFLTHFQFYIQHKHCFKTTLLMLPQKFPNTLERIVLPAVSASSSATSSNMPRAKSNAPILAETLRLLVLVLVKARMQLPRVVNVVSLFHILSFLQHSTATTHSAQFVNVDTAIASYYSDGSRDSLQHRFRPIIADAQALRNGGCEHFTVPISLELAHNDSVSRCLVIQFAATALQLIDDTTASAVVPNAAAFRAII